jgi:aryl-alcohol dehydrogenase-like predicted oxidoreductase
VTALLGMGTYRTRHVPKAAEAAVQVGVDWIDTAPNYQQGTAERQLAPVLEAHRRVHVSTKVGFLSGPQQDEAVRAGALTQPQAGTGFSLDPLYMAWQAARSKAALGRTPDITFMHNPEHGSPAPVELAARIQRAFRTLEECCDQGLTTGYGVTTWSSLHDGSLTIEKLIDMARSAGGPAHRLRAVQLPLSLVQFGPIADAVAGHGVLIDAQSAGLAVYASAPLHAGELPAFITPAAAQELLPGATPLRLILGTVASAPGVSRILLSASTPKHWSEAGQAALAKPLDADELRRITDAFTT